jgi:hypothetical protein
VDETIAELIAHDRELEARRAAAIAVLEQAWQAAAAPPAVPGGVLGRFMLRLAAPLLERQQAYNTAALQALYQLSEIADHRRSMLYLLIEMLDRRYAEVSQRAGRLEQHNRMLYEQIRLIGEQLVGLEDADAQLLAAIARAEALPPSSAVTGAGDEQLYE